MKKFEKHRDMLFSTLSEITSLIIAGNDKRIIIQRLLDTCLVVLDAERVHLLELDGARIVKYSKSNRAQDGDELRIEVLTDSAVLRDWMFKETEERQTYERGGELAFDLPMLTHSFLGDDDGATGVIISAPLVAKKSMFGLLIAIHRDDGSTYAAEDIKLLTILANQAAIAVENALLYQKLEMEAITDGLTAVFNYRYLMQSLETEIKRARRFKQSFSFVMLDIDNLKRYNDTNGHLSGSQALKDVAMLIKSHCREIDLVSKYGGDEFAVLLPQTNMEGALHVTHRVIHAIQAYKFDGKHPGLLTCSGGISTFPADGQCAREVIDAADKALYQAKRSGRNKVLTTEQALATRPH